MLSAADSIHALRDAVEGVHSLDHPGRPEVTLAWAQSLDGSIARRRGDRTALSGPGSLLCTHTLRSMHDALLVGIGTVCSDAPRLTVREVPGESPAVVVLDSALRTPSDAPLFESGVPVYLFHRTGAIRTDPLPGHAETIAVPQTRSGDLNLSEVLKELFNRGVGTLMVEGGAYTITSFLNARIVDLAAVTVAPVILGGYGVIPREGGLTVPVSLKVDRYLVVGDDVLVLGSPTEVQRI